MVIWMIPVTALIYNGMARLISMDADSENLFMAVILLWNRITVYDHRKLFAKGETE